MASASSQDKITTAMRRILVLTPVPPISKNEPLPISPFLHALTGVAPVPEQISFAGYTQHQALKLVTKYYSCNVGLWCDEVPAPPTLSPKTQPEIASDVVVEHEATADGAESTLAGWTEQMLSDAAEEVRTAIGAIVLLLPVTGENGALLTPGHVEIINAVDKLKEAIEDGEFREVATVLLFRAPGSDVEGIERAVQQMESILLEDIGIFGWDVAGWGEAVTEARMPMENGKRNEHGEKTGLARVKEVFEAVNWFASDVSEAEADSGFLDGTNPSSLFPTESVGEDAINLQARGLEQEFMGLKLAMAGFEEKDELLPSSAQWPNDEIDEMAVEQLQSLMERAMAMREAAAELAPADRNAFAKREVAYLMKDID